MIELSIKFFALLNPLGCMAQFVSLLRWFPPARQRLIILRESLIALMILLLANFYGDRALYYLGIQLTALKVGGGLILLLVALPMLFPTQSTESKDRDNVPKPAEPCVVPLAIPLLAGPGILTMVLIESGKAAPGQTAAALFAVWSICLAVLMLAPHIGRYLGEKGLAVLDRFVGLILIFISVNMMLEGLKSHFDL